MRLNKEEIVLAIQWLCECSWPDVDSEEIEQMEDARIERAIEKHFDGGIASFKSEYCK